MKAKKALIFLTVMILLVGCKPVSLEYATATASPAHLATISPSPTATPTPPATPTLLIPVLAGTPHFTPSIAISASNLEQLTLLASYGNGYIGQLTWSPDGSRVAASTSRGVAFFTAADLSYLHTLPSSTPFNCLTFSPDGSKLAAGSNTGKITVWDTGSEKIITELQTGIQPVVTLAFDQDGTALAASTRDNALHLWDTTTWSKSHTLNGHQFSASALQFSSDGGTLFSFTPKEQVKRWQLPGGTPGKELYIGIDSLKNAALAGAFSEDGTCFAAAQNNAIRIFDTNKGTTLFLLSSFLNRVTTVSVNTDCSLLSAVDGSRLTVWDIRQQSPALTLEIPLEIIPGSLSFSPDGEKLLLGSPALAVADITGKSIQPLSGASFSPGSAINRDYRVEEENLTRTFIHGAVQQVELRDGSLDWTLLTSQRWNVSAISPDGEWTAGGGVDGQISIWNTTSPQAAKFMFYPDRTRSPSTALMFDPNGKRLAAANASGKVWMLSIEDGSIITELQPGFTVSTLRMNPSGNLLLAAGRGHIQVYQAGTGIEWKPGASFNGLQPFFLSEDVLLFRSYSQDSSPVIFANPLTGNIFNQVVIPPGELAVSNDGSLLVVSGIQLQFYSLPGGDLLYGMDAGSPYVHVYFNQENTLLVTVDWDGVIQLWGIETE